MSASPADRRPRLRISAASGGVKLVAERRDDVVVDGRGSIAPVADGAIEVRAGRASDSVAVRCPIGSDVVIGTRSGTVELLGEYGTVGITSQSGSIRVDGVSAADLRTVSGAVELDRCGGRCRISTTSGRIHVGTTQDAEISTTTGRVQVGGVTGLIRVRSVSGRVTVTSAGLGPVQVSTVSGSIAIRLPPGLHPNVLASGSGHVRSSFEPGDDVDVQVAVVSGTVRVEPA